MGDKSKTNKTVAFNELEEERNDLLEKCSQIFTRIRSDFNLQYPTDQYVQFNRQYAAKMKKEFELFAMCMEEVYQMFEADGDKTLNQNIQLNDSKSLQTWDVSDIQKMSRHKVKVMHGSTDDKAQEARKEELSKALGINADPIFREPQMSQKELMAALDEKRRNLSMKESKAGRYIKQQIVSIKQQLQKEKMFAIDFEDKLQQQIKKTVFVDGGGQVAGILNEITSNLDKNAKTKLMKVLEILFSATKQIYDKTNSSTQTSILGNAIEEFEGKINKLNRKVYDSDRSAEQLLKEISNKSSKIAQQESQIEQLKGRLAKEGGKNESAIVVQGKIDEMQKTIDKLNKQLLESHQDKQYYQSKVAELKTEDAKKNPGDKTNKKGKISEIGTPFNSNNNFQNNLAINLNNNDEDFGDNNEDNENSGHPLNSKTGKLQREFSWSSSKVNSPMKLTSQENILSPLAKLQKGSSNSIAQPSTFLVQKNSAVDLKIPSSQTSNNSNTEEKSQTSNKEIIQMKVIQNSPTNEVEEENFDRLSSGFQQESNQTITSPVGLSETNKKQSKKGSKTGGKGSKLNSPMSKANKINLNSEVNRKQEESTQVNTARNKNVKDQIISQSKVRANSDNFQLKQHGIIEETKNQRINSARSREGEQNSKGDKQTQEGKQFSSQQQLPHKSGFSKEKKETEAEKKLREAQEDKEELEREQQQMLEQERKDEEQRKKEREKRQNERKLEREKRVHDKQEEREKERQLEAEEEERQILEAEQREEEEERVKMEKQRELKKLQQAKVENKRKESLQNTKQQQQQLTTQQKQQDGEDKKHGNVDDKKQKSENQKGKQKELEKQHKNEQNDQIKQIEKGIEEKKEDTERIIKKNGQSSNTPHSQQVHEKDQDHQQDFTEQQQQQQQYQQQEQFGIEVILREFNLENDEEEREQSAEILEVLQKPTAKRRQIIQAFADFIKNGGVFPQQVDKQRMAGSSGFSQSELGQTHYFRNTMTSVTSTGTLQTDNNNPHQQTQNSFNNHAGLQKQSAHNLSYNQLPQTNKDLVNQSSNNNLHKPKSSTQPAQSLQSFYKQEYNQQSQLEMIEQNPLESSINTGRNLQHCSTPPEQRQEFQDNFSKLYRQKNKSNSNLDIYEEDLRKKKNQIALNRMLQNKSNNKSYDISKKYQQNQLSHNSSNHDFKNQSMSKTTYKSIQDDFRLIDQNTQSMIGFSNGISAAAKTDGLMNPPFRKNTNPSTNKGTITKKIPFNEDNQFVRDLYEHMQANQLDLSKLLELEISSKNATAQQAIMSNAEQSAFNQPSLKILPSGKVVNTRNIGVDEFTEYYADLMQQHRRCGPLCYHLKRFYDKVDFNFRNYEKRQSLVCPTLVVQEVQREHKKQPARFNLHSISSQKL